MDAATKKTRIAEITAELNTLYPEIYALDKEVKGLRKKADQPRKEELKAQLEELRGRRGALDAERQVLEAEVEAAGEKSPRELAIEAIEADGFEIKAAQGGWLWLNRKREIGLGSFEFTESGALNVAGLGGKYKDRVRRAVEGLIEVVEIETARRSFRQVDPSTLDDPMDRLAAEAERAKGMPERGEG